MIECIIVEQSSHSIVVDSCPSIGELWRTQKYVQKQLHDTNERNFKAVSNTKVSEDTGDNKISSEHIYWRNKSC